MSNYVDLINERMAGYIVSRYPEAIYDAMNYSVKAGGKRMRPLIMLYTAEGFGGDIEKVLPFACALEFIHTYSLIHDDLPCMDNDDLRRGIPTNHKVYGEAMALLAGDALLNTAYEIMAGEVKNNVSYETASAMYEMAVYAGVNGMIGGQVVDILSENKQVDGETLSYIQINKTAAIITAAFVCGGLLSGADKEAIDSLRKAGKALGIAFQIKDDILDIISSTEVLGKPIGSDAKNDKTTQVSMYGMEQAEKDFENLSTEVINIIKGLNLKTNSLENYMMEMMKRNF